MLTLHLAKTIITNNGEPVIDGGLLIEGSKIIQIGEKEDFGSYENTKIIDRGNSLICPGFINLHAHLLYSKVEKTNGENGLFGWLENLTDKVISFSNSELINSVNHGINEALSCGTTFIVENTPNETSAEELSKSHLKALIGLEVFGSDEEKANEIFILANSYLENLQDEYHNLYFTFSPHAPYDVSAPLWRKLVTWAEENNKFLLTHLEESHEEKKWWQEKSGPGVNFWKKINKLEPKLKYWKKYKSGIDFLSKNDSLNQNLIAAHLCKADEEDLRVIKAKNIKLIHCPRSNFYLNNSTANLKLWNELGFLWGIGTDSLASNKDLDLLHEIKFTMKQQELTSGFKISAKEAFEAITINASKILKKENEIGALKKGSCADFLIFNTEKLSNTYNNPYDLVISSLETKKDLKEVWINGKQAWLSKSLLPKI